MAIVGIWLIYAYKPASNAVDQTMTTGETLGVILLSVGGFNIIADFILLYLVP
jgi:hypothetical protein